MLRELALPIITVASLALSARLPAQTFTDEAAASGCADTSFAQGVSWMDHDRDGDLDLFVAGARGEANLLYRNDGVLPFAEIAGPAGIAGPMTDAHGCTVGDYDNDGWVDVDFDDDGDLDIHSASTGRDRLYRNSGNANHWLQVVPAGTVDNRSAIGATVELDIAGARQWRFLNGSAGAFSQNVLPAHFGLGAANVVDRLTVHWLDGTQDTLLAVPGDQRVSIPQSSGRASVSPIGAGCPNAGGLTPVVSNFGLPVVGQAFALSLAQGASSVPVFWLTSALPAPAPFPLGNGCVLQPDVAALLTLAVSTTSPTGGALRPLSVPASRALIGGVLILQALLLDPTGSPMPGIGLRLTLSNGVALRFGAAP